MKNNEEKLKGNAVHKAQIFRARCNKGCYLGEWTDCFTLAMNFKKIHEKKFPGHHVYIEVEHIQCNIDKDIVFHTPQERTKEVLKFSQSNI